MAYEVAMSFKITKDGERFYDVDNISYSNLSVDDVLMLEGRLLNMQIELYEYAKEKQAEKGNK